MTCMKKDNYDDIPFYEEEVVDIATKEQEIMESYQDEDTSDEKSIKSIEEITNEYEEYQEDDYYIKREKRIKRIINIVFSIIVTLLILITIDVVCVAKYNKGPFFAIPTYTYQDGGTKEYYGIGYKVKEIQERHTKKSYTGQWSISQR